MSLPRRLSSTIIALTTLAVACGGAAAPTATPTARAVATATTAPAGGVQSTPTRPAAAAISTPTPTRAGAASPTAAPSGPVGKMVMAATADVTNLDPHVATAGGLQAFYTSDVFVALLSQLKPGPSQPWLAESWAWDEKGLKTRFVIRKGAKFQDGKPVTSDDIKFSVEKAKSPYAARGINSSQSPWMKDLQVIDDRTVVFTSRETNALAYGLFGGLITQPRHDPYEVMQKKPIGAGPYKVAEWRPFESLTMEASPYFWEPVAVKTVVRLVVPEPESRLAMLKSGQVDFMDEVQPRQAEDLAKDKRFRVKVTDAGNWVTIQFATEPKTVPGTDVPNPFLDVRVRRAFIMALDRKAIFDGVALGKYGIFIPGPWPRSGSGGTEEDKITPYKYDPAAAKKLLEEAKFPFDREWPIWVYRTSAGFAESAEVAVAQWNAIGVKARFRLTEVGTLMSYWQETPSRTYPLMFIRSQLSSIGEPPGYDTATHALPEGYLSSIGDTKLDEWMIKLRSAFDPAEREQIYKEIYRYEHDQAITFPLLGGVLVHAFDQRVNWDPIPGTMSVTHLWRSQWLQSGP